MEIWGASQGTLRLDLFQGYKDADPVGAIQTSALEKDKRPVLSGKKPGAHSIRVLTRTAAGNGSQARSVGKPHLLRVAQVVQVGVAGQLHHWGRPTEQQQHIVPRGGQVLLDHVRCHKALAVGPT